MSAPVTRFAPVKINLFLEVLGKRADGYHEVATVMETVGVGDAVTVEPAAELEVVADRGDVPSGPGNTVFKIVRAAERLLGRELPARAALAKRVAPGSGLGAGSSDAATALDLVLRLHGAAAAADLRRRICAEVGSDVGFFVDGGLALCTGRGEIVAPRPRRGARHVVLVMGGPACATPDVYRKVAPPERPMDPAPWLDALDRGATLCDGDGPPPFNRLERAAELAYPALGDLRRRLEGAAGRPPHLSGSGGTFFFLAPTQEFAAELAARLCSACPDLDVRATASYRGPVPESAA
jgi:4-diphosphocytidyl-2-C-methyl-D-erythritol kinase